MNETKTFEQTLTLLRQQLAYSNDEAKRLKQYRSRLYEDLGRTSADISRYEAVVHDLEKSIEVLEAIDS